MTAREAALSIVTGVARLARFRADGIAQFGATPHAFMNSMAPLIAFPLAGGMLLLLAGGGAQALSDTLATLVALLAPPVLSYALASYWGRQALWLRYAVAFNWSRWVMLPAMAAFSALMTLMIALGLAESAALAAGLVAVLAYGVSLDWFVARVGLDVGRWRAVLLVVVTDLGTVLLFQGPRVIATLAGS
jgi:hypothetical protein